MIFYTKGQQPWGVGCAPALLSLGEQVQKTGKKPVSAVGFVRIRRRKGGKAVGSKRLTFLTLWNSSLAATSDTGTSLMPSFWQPRA